MFGLRLGTLGFIVLAAISAGGIAYVFLFNSISSEKTVNRRLEVVKKGEADRQSARAVRERTNEAARRRKTIQDTLHELEQKQKNQDRNVTNPPLKVKLKQAGMEVSLQKFYILSGVTGFLLAFILLLFGAHPLVVLASVVVGAVGLPRWFVNYMRKRRVTAFLEEFPNALDVIVRAIRSGLPFNDAVRMIAAEAREPVRTEFRRIVEAQQIGLSSAEATARMTETMPCPEANFFGIVIQIQSQSGGNLSEALGNLSRVLRNRKKMKARIQALSMEAKASAFIIGSLPPLVATIVFVISPDYIMPLFTTSTGHFLLLISAFWMGLGIFIMRQMINFEV
ncbi:pilus assembly protein [Nitratireductor aestuarii]|uniref:Pilus assembly protein n=1 Tax=Nitratireductor aestuarii TaxID=1735103 RepID=A0A916W157_9HYPH|nr:type II secretion system F family protein [Nitratireductor aestuarii]GGA57724.1 pilus assembly protein [Nitratireductor aestuarii]